MRRVLEPRALLFLGAFLVEYVSLVFSFPVENHLFHMQALNPKGPYAQFMRDGYIKRFPDSKKAEIYRHVNDKIMAEHQAIERRYSL